MPRVSQHKWVYNYFKGEPNVDKWRCTVCQPPTTTVINCVIFFFLRPAKPSEVVLSSIVRPFSDPERFLRVMKKRSAEVHKHRNGLAVVAYHCQHYFCMFIQPSKKRLWVLDSLPRHKAKSRGEIVDAVAAAAVEWYGPGWQTIHAGSVQGDPRHTSHRVDGLTPRRFRRGRYVSRGGGRLRRGAWAGGDVIVLRCVWRG
jgi:hypothetical protein